ncbi:hypothetical protein [Sphaerisporangium sp. TRM90804]|uniref:hypothetical protein n=1 Tax=Sphaerisporangium sp. TRM90804 TaxID=3031113 RepID=UPI00244D0784|nr:hypothetical protein [Sphaerisporangium sp. TRM90804]MDH2429804.1 hypothetical protein [Sphaerisporangium sp. TRM90804]
MGFLPAWSADMPYMNEELVRDRIRTLHQEAEEQRLILRMQRIHKARKRAERASVRLHHALARLA